MDPLIHAKFFAATKHEGQKYGVLPYTHHLHDVENVLRRFDVDEEELFVAAWLHDVVEDTPTKIKEITEVFGVLVSDLVYAVTKEKGENRKVRAFLTYEKTRACESATTLKLADRIANVEAGGSLFKMYRDEYDTFKRMLYVHRGDPEHPERLMWAHLDMLFKVEEMRSRYGDITE